MGSTNRSGEPIELVATFLGFNGIGKTTLLYNILDGPVPDPVPKVLPWNEEPGNRDLLCLILGRLLNTYKFTFRAFITFISIMFQCRLQSPLFQHFN